MKKIIYLILPISIFLIIVTFTFHNKNKPTTNDNIDLNVAETGVIKGEYIVEFVEKEGDVLEERKTHFKRVIDNIGGTFLDDIPQKPIFLVKLNEEQLDSLRGNTEIHSIEENIGSRTIVMPFKE